MTLVAAETLIDAGALLLSGNGKFVCDKTASSQTRARTIEQVLFDDHTQVFYLVMKVDDAMQIGWICDFYVKNAIVVEAVYEDLFGSLCPSSELLCNFSHGKLYYMRVVPSMFGARPVGVLTLPHCRGAVKRIQAAVKKWFVVRMSARVHLQRWVRRVLYREAHGSAPEGGEDVDARERIDSDKNDSSAVAALPSDSELIRAAHPVSDLLVWE